MVEVLLADLLSLGSIEIELVETLMQELVGADDCLLELRESFGGAELLDFGGRPRGSGGSADEGGGLEQVGLLVFLVLREVRGGELEGGGRAVGRGVVQREGGELFHRLQYNYYDGLPYAED